MSKKDSMLNGGKSCGANNNKTRKDDMAWGSLQFSMGRPGKASVMDIVPNPCYVLSYSSQHLGKKLLL